MGQNDKTFFANKTRPNNMDAFWMPFTQNRYFKKAPRLLVSAQDMHYTDSDGNQVLDGSAGLWSVNAGHNRPRIVEAIQKQAAQLDYVPNFQLGAPVAFDAAAKLCAAMPWDFNNVFFSNSGSEAVDTSLKIAIAYHRAKGNGTKQILVGRERAYHGVGFGGMSVGGIPYLKKVFGNQMIKADHLPHTMDITRNNFVKGQPEHGVEYADYLERIVNLHDPENVAAVIVEPVSGSTGILPPPKGYLERLREICDKYDLLLIFDEVATGFGRMGYITAAEYFNVKPDIICAAKGITNSAVPMGATFVTQKVYDAFMQGDEYTMELMHGYTYSGHPLACAAAIATLEEYQAEKLFENARAMEKYFGDKAHSMRDARHIIDIRNIGIFAALELAPAEDGRKVGRAMEVFLKCFERGLMAKYTGNVLTFSPPLRLNESHIDQIFDTVRDILSEID